MKYVIVELDRKKLKSATRDTILPKWPILFSESIVHADVVPQNCVAVSAGDCHLRPGGKIACSGKSETLGLVSEPVADSYLINQWLMLGESMMVMASEKWEQLSGR